MPKPADRTYFNPGDTLWFCGRGFVPRSIALWTCSPAQLFRGQLISHCGIIAEAFGRRPLHFESTTLNDKACAVQFRNVNGVQAHDPREQIESYQGRVYLGRLVEGERLGQEQSRRLTGFLGEQLGAPYDMQSALLAGTRFIKRWFAPDATSLFCDELVAMALMHVKALPRTFNPSSVTPAWLARHMVNVGVMQKLVRVR
jgi:hypothetical protein